MITARPWLSSVPCSECVSAAEHNRDADKLATVNRLSEDCIPSVGVGIVSARQALTMIRPCNSPAIQRHAVTARSGSRTWLRNVLSALASKSEKFICE